MILRRLLLLLGCLGFAHGAASKVLINEIMYNPGSLDPREEYIELFNHGPDPVNLAGWRLHSAVRYVFPSIELMPGGYLVVAADLAVFQQKHPGPINVLGPWEGSLSNTDEDIDLDDASSNREDSVDYASEGDWALRARGPLDNGHRGWVWQADHDGRGKSLELINPEVSNNYGQNWGASRPVGGTPGAPNSIGAINTPPLILETAHAPIIPRSSERVTVTARLLDENPIGLRAILHYRLDGETSFKTVAMIDDGQHGDGAPGDTVFGAAVPAQRNNTVVEFYVEAFDADGRSRTWPAPAAGGSQTANLLYQVRDAGTGGTAGSQPFYLLIMTETERDELHELGHTLPDANSDAQMNGTFISVDADGTKLRYLTGIRNRGHGTRTAIPNNYHVSFRSDDTWQGRRGLSLNSQYPHSQVLGSRLFQRAGLAALDAWAVQVRVNNENLAKSGLPQFGSYAAVEVLNGDYIRNHFPLDSQGNAYRGVASDPPSEVEADLFYRGSNPNAYRPNYPKQNNLFEDDWTDLIRLTRVLSQTPASDFLPAVSQVLDVQEWLRYFAMNALLENNETGIYMGFGDDYALYRGAIDQRFKLIPYDLDTLMGEGAEPGTNTAGIFRSTALTVIKSLLRNPAIEPLYYAELRSLIETIFSPGQLNPLIDETLGDWVPAATISKMKNFAASRNGYVSSLLPHLISYPSNWRYRQPNVGLNPSWTTPGFDDSSWPSGEGLLYFDSRALPAPKGTSLKLGKSTYYFRTRFRVNASLLANRASLRLTCSTIIDDGAVFYLNGREIFRLGMPEGAVAYETTANRLVSLASIEGPFLLPADALVAGDNVLAVEVHQTDPTSSDVVFGLTLDLATTQSSGQSAVLLNEISATQPKGPGENSTDWIELFNPTSQSIDLEDASLTDNNNEPRKWVFPANSVLPPHGYLVISADGDAPASARNTGFGLKAEGDQVYFLASTAQGGALIDSIQFGLQIAGRTIGRTGAPPGVWALTDPTPGAANVASGLGQINGLSINEWLANPASGDSWFEIYNSQTAPVALSGLYLTDSLANSRQWQFPPLSFIGGGPAAYQRFEADADPQKGADHVSFQLNPAGGQIALLTGDGQVLNQVTFGPQVVGVSEGRFPDGGALIARFADPSPGGYNFVPLTNVVINEVLAAAAAPLEPAIELFNPGNVPVDISGWFLSDDPAVPVKFRIPPGTVIPANGFQAFYAFQFQGDPSAALLQDSANGGQIILSAVDLSGVFTGYRAAQNFPAAAPGRSVGRVETSQGGDFVRLTTPTFGADSPASVDQFRLGRGAVNAPPQVGPVVITELNYLPQERSGTNLVEKTELEFIELYNTGLETVPLFDPLNPERTWLVRGGADLSFPTGLQLPPGGTLLLVNFDPTTNGPALQTFRQKYGVPESLAMIGPYDGKLSNGGEKIELAQPGGAAPDGSTIYFAVDRVHYGVTDPWPVLSPEPAQSLSRRNPAGYGDDPENWQAATPTPGRLGDQVAAVPSLTALLEQGEIILRFHAEPGISYAVEYRESVAAGDWLKLADLPVSAEARAMEFRDGVQQAARFYRLRSGP